LPGWRRPAALFARTWNGGAGLRLTALLRLGSARQGARRRRGRRARRRRWRRKRRDRIFRQIAARVPRRPGPERTPRGAGGAPTPPAPPAAPVLHRGEPTAMAVEIYRRVRKEVRRMAPGAEEQLEALGVPLSAPERFVAGLRAHAAAVGGASIA